MIYDIKMISYCYIIKKHFFVNRKLFGSKSKKDKGLYDPNSSPSGLGGTIHSDMLINGSLECISCHDIHGMSGENNYLIKSNYGSKLCLTCHDK